MKQQLNGDWAQKILTSKRTVLGLSVAAGMTALLAYESAKITDETRESVQQTTVVSPEGDFPENGHEFKVMQSDGQPRTPGVELAYSGTKISFEDNILILEKDREYNVNLPNGRTYKVSETFEPVAGSCDRICAEARKVILSCYEEETGGCGRSDCILAVETLQPYPHRQRQ